MSPAHLIVVLHAHLPDLRRGGEPQERWLFEAVAQSYLPLIQMLEGLAREGVRVPIALSISPTLAAMLDDAAMMARCAAHLQALVELADAELRRHAWDIRLQRLAEYWRSFYLRACVELDRREGRLLPSLIRLAERGHLELFTTAATHGYLPLLAAVPSAAERQIRLGLDAHRQWSGRSTAGFWLPELAWSPLLEPMLRSQGVRWVCVDAHAVIFADRRPRAGTFTPVATPGNLVAFPRDAELSRAVWSAREGYPGAPWYLEYHRDLGWERTREELGPLAGLSGLPGPLGIKYHRVTGATDEKALYEPARAAELARNHAADFIRRALERAARAAAAMDRPPLLVAAFDAELFGHWWHEGPRWLEHVLRGLAATPCMSAITPSEYLDRHPWLQCATPAESSWGEGGGHATWWNPTTVPMWTWLHDAAARLEREERRLRGRRPPPRMADASRHLLQAQASDWMFMLSRRTTPDYARARWQQAVCDFESAMQASEA